MKNEEVVRLFLNEFLEKTTYNLEIRAIYKSEIKTGFFRDTNEAVKFIERFYKTKHIYFGVYSREGEKGTKEFVREATCLFADLDFDKYKNGEGEAKLALSDFPLQPSMIVHSGNGLHAYWMLQESIPADLSIERYLRGIAVTLKSDTTVAEIARILRVPGTFNQKSKPPKEVRLLEHNDNTYLLTDFDAFAVDEVAVEEEQQPSKYSIEFLTSNCEFIKYCYEESEKVSEPLWYMMVSNVSRLDANLVHELSKGYPKYNQREVDDKIIQSLKASGPHTCKTIKTKMTDELGSHCGKDCEYGSPVANIQFVKYKEENEIKKKEKEEWPDFQWRKGGLVWKKKSDKINTKTLEPEYFPICNFMAKIAKEITTDDGDNEETVYEIEAAIGEKRRHGHASVPVKNFPDMKWVMSSLGFDAVIEPGQMKDHVRHMIQKISTEIPPERETVYAYTGWKKDKDGWFYLTTNGAIGRDGVKTDIKFGENTKEGDIYCFPENWKENELEGIKASIDLLGVAKDEISIPIFLYTYLSVFTNIIDPLPNFVLFLIGETGSFKTTLAYLFMSHFGDMKQLSKDTYTFTSTTNAIERRGFTLKDTIMLLDDYPPGKNTIYETTMKRIVRNYGGRIGRRRLFADSSEKGSYPPRGLMIITGEQSIDIQSVAARMFDVDIRLDKIYYDEMTEMQNKAHLLRSGMCSFIYWLKDNIDDFKKGYKERFDALRNKFIDKDLHKRQLEYVVQMNLIAETLAKFFVSKKAMNNEESKKFLERATATLEGRDLEEEQKMNEYSEIELFFNTIDILVAQGKIYLYSLVDGECTIKPAEWKKSEFTKEKEEGTKGDSEIKFDKDNVTRMADQRIRGDFAGWHDDSYWYFMPQVLFSAITKHFKDMGRVFPLEERAMKKRLVGEGLLKHQGKSLSSVKNVSGKSFRILQINKMNLSEDTNKYETSEEGVWLS